MGALARSKLKLGTDQIGATEVIVDAPDIFKVYESNESWGRERLRCETSSDGLVDGGRGVNEQAQRRLLRLAAYTACPDVPKGCQAKKVSLVPGRFLV